MNFGSLEARVGIEPKTNLKTFRLLILTKLEKRQKHRICPSEEHAGYTGTLEG